MLKNHLISSYLITIRNLHKPLVTPVTSISNHEFLKLALETKQPKTPKEWKELRRKILDYKGRQQKITPINIDAITLSMCNKMKKYKLAHQYLDFLNSEGITINLASVSKVLQLMYSQILEEGPNPEYEERILKIYKDLKTNYPVLDSVTINNIIPALSITKEWRECLKLFEQAKLTSSIGSFAYNAIVSAAFLNNEEILAWNIFKQICQNERTPSFVIYKAYCSIINENNYYEKIETLFNFLHQYNLKLNQKSADIILNTMKKFIFNPVKVEINEKGYCLNCLKELKIFEPTDEEFQLLKDRIFSNALIGRDVFVRTDPEEVENFKKFIKNMPPFDIVIDGLNVAFSKGMKHLTYPAKLLRDVVTHFLNKNKKILVLGRSHMEKWQREHLNFIKNNATMYLTRDLSQDDPYLLYCALNSGRNTKIISKDLMRNHRHLLKDPHLESLFTRWLVQRQWILITVTDRGQAIFKKPLPYTEIVQKNGDYWHVPVENDDSVEWLCLDISKKLK